jgi:hypothetical protein
MFVKQKENGRERKTEGKRRRRGREGKEGKEKEGRGSKEKGRKDEKSCILDNKCRVVE